MKVLVVNDDGYQAEGLRILIDSLKKYVDVVAYSPLKCESAQSQKITIHKGIKVEKIGDINVVDGSTADCVRLGVFDHPDIDLVISGVNHGLNVGIDIYYSSTIAGIVQAGLFGYKGVAFSCDKNYKDVRLYIDDVVKEFVLGNSKYENLINVNFPTEQFSEYKGIKFTTRGKREFENKFTVNDGVYFETNVMNDDFTDGTDSGECNKGFISVSNLKLERVY